MQFALKYSDHGPGSQMKNRYHSHDLLSHSLLQSGVEGSVKTKKMRRSSN